MTDENVLAQGADHEVVQPEAEQVEAPEAVESTEGQDEGSQPAEEKPEGKAEDKPSPAKLRRERRKAAEAKRKAEQAETQEKLAQAQAKLKRFEGESRPPPKADDFENYEEYQAALSAHYHVNAIDGRERNAVSAEVEQYQRAMEQQEAARKAELRESWAEQMAEAVVEYPDFLNVFTDDLPITAEMGELIADSDNGYKIAYHLGKNPKEAARLSQLSPLQVAREIGALEARLSLPAKTTSTAPEPINPLSKGTGSAVNPENMSMAEYREWRANGGRF